MAGTVLIAEDNGECREMFSMIVAHLGLNVIQASNGLEAFEKAVTVRPDLILMDVRMPKLDGLEATKRLKANLLTKDIPVIICTATGKEVFDHVNALGDAVEVVQKPVNLQILHDVVRKYVPLPQQRVTLHGR
jgi:CheY-like chemotaxis protein